MIAVSSATSGSTTQVLNQPVQGTTDARVAQASQGVFARIKQGMGYAWKGLKGIGGRVVGFGVLVANFISPLWGARAGWLWEKVQNVWLRFKAGWYQAKHAKTLKEKDEIIEGLQKQLDLQAITLEQQKGVNETQKIQIDSSKTHTRCLTETITSMQITQKIDLANHGRNEQLAKLQGAEVALVFTQNEQLLKENGELRVLVHEQEEIIVRLQQGSIQTEGKGEHNFALQVVSPTSEGDNLETQHLGTLHGLCLENSAHKQFINTAVAHLQSVKAGRLSVNTEILTSLYLMPSHYPNLPSFRSAANYLVNQYLNVEA